MFASAHLDQPLPCARFNRHCCALPTRCNTRRLTVVNLVDSHLCSDATKFATSAISLHRKRLCEVLVHAIFDHAPRQVGRLADFSYLCKRSTRFLSAVMLSLSTMLHLALPHVNVLSKARAHVRAAPHSVHRRVDEPKGSVSRH